jgi:Flp pilus assembly protein TadG
VRRLTGRPRHPLSRLRQERGAMAVFFALFMPILFGLAAIAIDVAAVWSARQQVQNGADAAVLAVAMDCARNSCGDIKQTAEDAFWANDKAAKVSNLGPGEGWIRVSGRQVSATQKRDWEVNHFFAGALGMETGELATQSFAAWAPTASGRADAPVGVSWCFYRDEVGSYGPRPSATARIPLTTAISESTCSGPAGAVRQGTALTVPSGTGCGTTSQWKASVKVSKKTYGSGLGPACSTSQLAGLVGDDIVVPVWNAATAQSVSAPTFTVHGYAAFRVTSYDSSGPALNGYFTYAPKQIDATTPPPTTAPDLGSRAVYLDHQ